MLYKRIEMRLSQKVLLLVAMSLSCLDYKLYCTAALRQLVHPVCLPEFRDNLQKEGNGQKPSLTLGARPSCPNVQDATLSCHSYWLFCGIELHFCMVQ